MDTRQCTACKLVKSLDEFYASKHQAGGHRYECKACAKVKAVATRAQRVQRPTPDLPAEKHCPRCHETLPASAFSVDLGNASGLRAYCKRCSSALTRARQLKQPLAPTPPCNECLRLQSARGQTVAPRPIGERFWEKVDMSQGPESCWPWTGATQKGYGAFGTRQGHLERAHRMAWMLTHGEIPDGVNVLHHCDNPLCCNPHPKHLFLGTLSDNTRDMHAKGRDHNFFTAYYAMLSEETLPLFHKLTIDDVRYIYGQHGITSAGSLAQRFSVAESTIYRIWSGRTWDHIEK